MAEFEVACQARGIRPFVLPPREPYEVTDAEPDLASLEAELRPWAISTTSTRV